MKRALIGKLLISLVAIETGVGAFVFDFDRTHVFNPGWGAHARFHGAVGVFLAAGLALLSLWFTWRHGEGERTRLAVSAWLAALYFLSFFPAALIPGAGLSEPGNEIPLVAGLIAPQLLEGGFSVGLVVLGYALARAPAAAPRRG